MSKMNQVYGIGQALIPVLPPPLPFQNAPTSNQTNYELGQVVFSPPRNPTAFYIYSGSGVWSQLLSSNPVVVSAAASPQTANGKTFSVTFSGVSIAAGATQSFVISNTAVNTLVQVSMVGATSGAALSIQSVTNSPGVSTTIVVTNGTGATTTTANITFTGICLN